MKYKRYFYDRISNFNYSIIPTDYVKYMQGEATFTPPYSSRLNNCEHSWAVLKKLWSNYVSRITVDYNHKNLTRDVKIIADLVGSRLTAAILTSTDHLHEKCLQGELL